VGGHVARRDAAAQRVRDLDLADDDVGGPEQGRARLEERVRVGLVEDEVADEQDPGAEGLR